jgi:4-amino-4-deoxy-L-arabinose transferase-like glycosyltransferase
MDGCIVQGRNRQHWLRFTPLLFTCFAALGPGLGSALPLTYHEAFVAQGASEMLASSQWWHPTIGSLPWLEKPPLPFWLVAAMGRLTGELTPGCSRLPFAIAGTALVFGVAYLGARRFGPTVGFLAGAIQATTAWWVFRSRLAEADILLACLMTWTLVAFDRIRSTATFHESEDAAYSAVVLKDRHFWRRVFFALLGLGALVKGTGFGAVLTLSVVFTVIVWGREWRVLKIFVWAPGWVVAGFLGLGWPLAMVARHGARVVGLWSVHVSGRLTPLAGHGPFAGEASWSYARDILGQGLPWTPLAIAGVLFAIVRRWQTCGAEEEQRSAKYLHVQAGNRLLWAWTFIPLVLVSFTRVRNAHYAIYAMIPWSFWSAFALIRIATVLRHRGWWPARLGQGALATFPLLSLSYGLGYCLVGSQFSHHGLETDFYERVGRQLRPAEELILLYDDWDRDPYDTPFGPIPHDLAIRLYYLGQPACWHFGVPSLAAHPRMCTRARSPACGSSSLLIIGRDRDLDALGTLGSVQVLARGSTQRWDRSYVAARLWPYVKQSSPSVVPVCNLPSK